MTSRPVHITSCQTLRCGAGFRDFCFVKVTTDGVTADGEDIVGWSEYIEERNIGVTAVIQWMGQLVVGKDALSYGKLVTRLKMNTRHVVGGIAQHAVAAIENAVLDVVGKAYGVPVCALFGGPYHEELPVYWSHCGSFRASYHQHLHSPFTKQQVPPLHSLDDVTSLCEEVKRSGHTALKTNIFHFRESGSPGATLYMPGFGAGSSNLEPPRDFPQTIAKQMRTFRQGVGNDIGLKLDLNYNFKTEAYLQIVKALTPEALGGAGLDWVELDLYSPRALRQIRDAAPMPVASLESLMGRSAILPYLEAGSVDVCIVDPLWNGVAESVKMAELCDVYGVNCAAHNYHGWLGTAICAHFCAAIPNMKVLEVDVDDVPWKDDIVKEVPSIDKGVFRLPLGRPGWGVEVDEEAMALPPPLDDPKSGIWK